MKYILITGATSGIGESLALHYIAQKQNIIITGRNIEKLEQLRSAYNGKNGVEVISFSCDLSRILEVESLIDFCKDYDIETAILNAGFGTSGAFHHSSKENELNMIDVNVRAVCSLSHYFVNIFLERNYGSIVFISSIVGLQPVPNSANYSATKAYIDSFSRALSYELSGTGVNILSVYPGPVETGFASRANMKMGGGLSPDIVAGSIIRAIGKQKILYPGFLSKLLGYSLLSLPRWIRIIIMKSIMKGFTQHQQK